MYICTIHHCALEAHKWSIHECFLEIGYEFFVRTKRMFIILATPVFLSHYEVLPSTVAVCHSKYPLYQSVHILDECLRSCCHLVQNAFRNSYHSILTHVELLNTVLMESLIISFANFHLILSLKYIKSYLTGKLVLSIFFVGISISLVLCHS